MFSLTRFTTLLIFMATTITATAQSKIDTTEGYRHLQTEITINAPASAVWAILTDFDHYADWNPFIRSISGSPQEGQVIVADMYPDGKKHTFKPVVKVAVPNQHFAWKGKLWTGGFFDGEHHYELTTLPDGRTLFYHHEKFSGILVPMLKKQLVGETRTAFEAMNQALKSRAEALATK